MIVQMRNIPANYNHRHMTIIYIFDLTAASNTDATKTDNPGCLVGDTFFDFNVVLSPNTRQHLPIEITAIKDSLAGKARFQR